MSLKRVIGWTALVLFLTLLLPVLAWWVANRIDEAPSADAAWLAQPFSETLPDERNAWLLLMGLGAAEDADPIAHGRARVDAWEARVRRRARADADDPAAPVDALPYVGPDIDLDGTDALCPRVEHDCIRWAGRHLPMLARLEVANAVQLARYRQVLGMDALQEVGTPGLEEPTADFAISRLHLTLIARDLSDPASVDAAMESMVQSARFWQRTEGQARSILMKSVARARLESLYRLIDAWLDREGTEGARRHAPALEAILRPPSAAQLDWEAPMRHHFQEFAGEVRGAMIRGPGDWWRCRGAGRGDCAKAWLMGQAYLHQATVNLRARLIVAHLDVHRAAAGDVDQAMQDYADVWESQAPLHGDFSSHVRLLAYNFSGKVLSAISSPALGYVYDFHDREALRRLVLLKATLLAEGSDPDDASFVDAKHRQRDPYSGDAFDWDGVRQAWSFVPRSPRWSGGPLRVRYATTSASGARACEVAFDIGIGLRLDHHTMLPLRDLESCAYGGIDADFGADTDEAEAAGYATEDTAVRLIHVRDGDEPEISMLLLSTTVTAPDGTQFDVRHAMVTKAGMYIEVTDRPELAFVILRGPSDRPFVSLELEDVTLAEAALAVQGLHGLELRGIERLPDRHLRLNGDMPLAFLLELLEDQADLALYPHSESVVEFVHKP